MDDPTRDEKVENLVTNFAMIMMGMLEGVFATMAAGLAEAMSKTAEAMAGEPVPKQASGQEVDAKVREMFSGLRKEVMGGFAQKNEKFEAFIRDSSFDAGIRIVEKHDLGIPKLTDRLTDEDLARYANLIQNEDPKVSKLMAELADWQKTTPRFNE